MPDETNHEMSIPMSDEDVVHIRNGQVDTEVPSMELLAAKEDDVPQEELADKPMGAVEPILNGDISGDKVVPTVEVPIPFMSEKSMTDILITEDDIRKLWDRTKVAQEAIIKNISKSSLAEELFGKIEQARENLMLGKDQYEESDNLLCQVEYQIGISNRILNDSRKVAPFLFFYELVIMILIGVGMLYFFGAILDTHTFLGKVNVSQFISTLLWGSLGGIVGALYALWKHVASKQDFDARYSLWYITNPILGLALGAFTFLVIQAGFFSLTAGSANNEMIQSAYMIYLFAWIVGFKQNVVYEIVRRILDVFAIKKDEEELTTENISS